MRQPSREHEVLVCLRPELLAELAAQGVSAKEWPLALHRALAREYRLSEELWPPRPVGRPPGGASVQPKPAVRKEGKRKFWSNLKTKGA
jgi:hypothetical protein